MVLFERLVGRRQPIEGADGTADGWTWVEEKLPPSPLLANAATALAPFALPKLGQAAIQFWIFKPSMGDLPTTAAVALQLYALPVYEQWRERPERGRRAAAWTICRRSAEEIRRARPRCGLVMGRLRQMFLADPQLADRVQVAARAAAAAARRCRPRRCCARWPRSTPAPRDRYLNFYGPPGTIRTIPYSKLVQPGTRTASSRSG